MKMINKVNLELGFANKNVDELYEKAVNDCNRSTKSFNKFYSKIFTNWLQ